MFVGISKNDWLTHFVTSNALVPSLVLCFSLNLPLSVSLITHCSLYWDSLLSFIPYSLELWTPILSRWICPYIGYTALEFVAFLFWVTLILSKTAHPFLCPSVTILHLLWKFTTMNIITERCHKDLYLHYIRLVHITREFFQIRTTIFYIS